MNEYRYETHMHTSEGSACGKLSGHEQALQYKEAGYDGIIVTDHFFNGNCAVPKNLPWEERVNRFCLGYEHALETGKEIGLDVFFGWEANYSGTEFLIYGLDKAYMLAHPEMEFWTVEQQYEEIKKAGGVVIQAHPFRDADYIPEIHLYPHACDAIEGFNYANRSASNAWAARYGKEWNFPMTAGSDCHDPGRCKAGISFAEKVTSPKDLVDWIQAGKMKTFPAISEEGWREGEYPFAIPAFLHNKK